MANIAKLNSLVMTGVNKVSLVVKASVKKICGVERITLPSSWYVHFDNTQWSAIAGSWIAGQGWQSNGSGDIILSELGTWVEGNRPTKCRITFARGYTFDHISIRNSDGTITYGTGPTGSMFSATFNITCTGDIGRLYTSINSTDHWITNIEFYGTS